MFDVILSHLIVGLPFALALALIVIISFSQYMREQTIPTIVGMIKGMKAWLNEEL